MMRARWLVLMLFIGTSTTGCLIENDEDVGDMPAECSGPDDCEAGQNCIDGTCVESCDCPAIYAPVCGDDGETYGNECQARCAGANPIADGECEACACPEIYAPVCGEDGQTYGNECEARCAEVSVAADGECDDGGACDGDAGDCGPVPDVAACPDGSGPDMACDRSAAGVCEWLIGECGCACPEIYEPVCGEDGQTYGNACEARCAGVPVDYEGECRGNNECAPEDCGEPPAVEQCLDGSSPEVTCEPTARGCQWQVGQCEDECACPEIYEPVCGEDGVTYGNACEARCAGVPVDYEGECRGNNECGPEACGPPPPVAPCPDGNGPEVSCEPNAAGECAWNIGPCEGGDICGLPADPGPCEAAMPRWYFDAERGACAEFIYGGCDGNENNFRSREECEATCGGGPNRCEAEDCGPRPRVACENGEAPAMSCEPTPNGACEWDVAPCEGECVCGEIWAPVCGVNGQTYGNACEAECAGVRIAYEGECRDPNVCDERACGPMPEPRPCDDGSLPEMACVSDAAGECAWVAGPCEGGCICPQIWAPVCGVDGETYGNACEAECAGVRIAYEGECEANNGCDERACGPMPDDAICPDGQRPPMSCEPQADNGECGWVVGPCQGGCDCPAVWSPVCGVDGRTYGNACEARCAGVEVRHEGECEVVEVCEPRACGDRPDVRPCDDGTFPELVCAPDADGACSWRVGLCEGVGCICPDVWAPVCGADGQTYGNDCEADCAGVRVVGEGECRDENICNQPAEPGPCEAAFPRWYYDAERGACAEFIYGGCMGNENNFETREECARACPGEGGGGACEPEACGPAPGAPNFECPDGSIGGPVCERSADGACGWDFRECPPVEECLCIEIYDPVCGADGETYANACFAECANARIAYEGECRQLEACGERECGPAPRPRLCDDGNPPVQECIRDAAGECGWITECREVAACGFEDCGPPPPVAPCPDGIGPSVECVARDDGQCGWEIGVCEEPQPEPR